MNELTQNKLESYAHRILNDYDAINAGVVCGLGIDKTKFG